VPYNNIPHLKLPSKKGEAGPIHFGEPLCPKEAHVSMPMDDEDGTTKWLPGHTHVLHIGTCILNPR